MDDRDSIHGKVRCFSRGRPSLTSGVTGSLSLGVKWQGRKTDQSFASSADVQNAWNYTFTPHKSLCRGVYRG
jgi:hypothetical protein